MGRGGAGILAALLGFVSLTGCRTTADTKSRDREPSGTAASRAKTKDGTAPAWLDPTAKLPGNTTGVPKSGGTAGDPKSKNFNAKQEAQDVLSGNVVDISGRAAKNIFIRVEAVNDPPGAAAKGIYTDNNGYFITHGLNPGVAYNLIAEASQDGKQLVGTVQTLVPNPTLTIKLREDNGLPPVGTPKLPVGTTGSFPPPPAPTDGDHIPPMGLAPITPKPPRTDAAFTPGTGATNSAPTTIGGTTTPTPGGSGGLPAPDNLAPPKSIRPENVAEGTKNPFSAPPVVSIPGPPLPAYPVPPPAPATPDAKQSRVRPGANFTLVDSLARNWDFGTDKSGSVVLIEFVTTACPACKPVVPLIKDLQSRYGADGLQVVAVLCDEVALKPRMDAAVQYSQTNNVNYAVYVEPGTKSGAVRDKFDVESYPTAILLDATGAVLWKGHPGKKAELDAAIKRALVK